MAPLDVFEIPPLTYNFIYIYIYNKNKNSYVNLGNDFPWEFFIQFFGSVIVCESSKREKASIFQNSTKIGAKQN